MKLKIQLLFMTLIVGATMSLSAQNPSGKTPVTPEEVAQKVTEKMTAHLSLTSDQQTQIKAINLKYAQQRHDAAAKVKGQSLTEEQKKQMKENAKASFTAQEAEFKTVLTPEQYDKFQKHKKELMERSENKMGKP